MGRAHRKTQSRAEVIDGAVANLRGVRFEGLPSAQICSAPLLGKKVTQMRDRIATITWLAAAFIVCLLIQRTAMSQSTILNVPSSDVVSAKKLYAEFDFITNYAWERHGSFRVMFRAP